MIVSITDSLDEDDDYRKEGSKGGGGGRGGGPTILQLNYLEDQM